MKPRKPYYKIGLWVWPILIYPSHSTLVLSHDANTTAGIKDKKGPKIKPGFQVEQSCVVDACNQSLLKYQLYPQGESKTWGMIVKGELALPMSCTSYQECGCHMNINRGEISNRAVLNSKGALALFYYFNSAGASLICFHYTVFIAFILTSAGPSYEPAYL